MSIRAVLWDADGVLQQVPGSWATQLAVVLGEDQARALLVDTWPVAKEAMRGRADLTVALEKLLAEHGVAEEFEALVGGFRAGILETRMRHRAFEAGPVGEADADPVFEAIERCARSPYPSHVRMRPGRRLDGHCQTSSGEASFSIEKKMTCALPTKFSNGT